MTMLYIDVYFLVNWWMDVLLLSVAAVWRRTRLSAVRIAGAAALGAFGACAVKVLTLQCGMKWISVCGVWFLLGVMVRAAFGQMRLRYFAAACGQVLLLAWGAAGILDFLYYQTGAGEMVRGILYGENGSPGTVWLFWWSLVLSGGGSMVMEMMANNTWVKSPVCWVEMEFRDKKVECRALFDSGNRLFTHLGAPVTIVESSVMEQLLEPKEWESLRYWTEIGIGYPERFLQFQLVPYHSVGQRQGVIPAIRIDRMTISKPAGEIVIKNPVIGFSEHAFTGEEEYRVILHGSY